MLHRVELQSHQMKRVAVILLREFPGQGQSNSPYPIRARQTHRSRVGAVTLPLPWKLVRLITRGFQTLRVQYNG